MKRAVCAAMVLALSMFCADASASVPNKGMRKVIAVDCGSPCDGTCLFEMTTSFTYNGLTLVGAKYSCKKLPPPDSSSGSCTSIIAPMHLYVNVWVDGEVKHTEFDLFDDETLPHHHNTLGGFADDLGQMGGSLKDDADGTSIEVLAPQGMTALYVTFGIDMVCVCKSGQTPYTAHVRRVNGFGDYNVDHPGDQGAGPHDDIDRGPQTTMTMSVLPDRFGGAPDSHRVPDSTIPPNRRIAPGSHIEYSFANPPSPLGPEPRIMIKAFNIRDAAGTSNTRLSIGGIEIPGALDLYNLDGPPGFGDSQTFAVPVTGAARSALAAGGQLAVDYSASDGEFIAIDMVALDTDFTLPPPSSDDCGAIGLGQSNTLYSFLSPAEIRWFKVHVPAEIARPRLEYFDIDTLGSSSGQQNDTMIGVYGADGTRLAVDDDAGDGLTSLLSYGRGTRFEPGGSLYSGLAGAFLDPGDYYIALGAYPMTFAPDFRVSCFSNVSLSGVLNLRSGVMQHQSPPSAQDLGLLQLPGLVVNNISLGAGQVRWLRFTLPENIIAPGRFLDIDTEGSLLSPSNDTEIGLYDSDGTLLAFDDDDGSGYMSQFSFGGGSTTPPVTGAMPYDGRDGLVFADQLYLVVGAYNIFFTDDWSVTGNSPYAGTVRLRFFTNAKVPGCPADFNGDGQIDFFDYLDFASAYSAGAASADFNRDGQVDFFDYLDFVQAYSVGC